MKKYIYSLVLLSFCIINVYAKTPPNGYLGKTIMVGYSAKISHPRTFGQAFNIIDVNNHFFLNYTLRDKRAIEAGITYGYLNYNKPTFIGSNILYSYHNFSIDVTYKFFPITGHYAPMGFYLGWGLIFNGMLFKYGEADLPGSATAYKVNSFMMPGIKYTMGRHYVLSNRILMNIGLDINFNVGALVMSVYDNYDPEKYSYQRVNAIQEGYKRMFSANGIQLNIGIGYLVK